MGRRLVTAIRRSCAGPVLPKFVTFGVVSLVAMASAFAQTAPASAPQSDPMLAPLPSKAVPASSHAPFEVGDCKVCHQRADPKSPGPVHKSGAAMCLDCHEDFAKDLKRPHLHWPVKSGCTKCHNPHNATQVKLLMDEPSAQCLGCHDDLDADLKKARIKHGVLATGKKCLNCHNPHASDVEKLLVKQPFDLCLSCHNDDRLTDANGRRLQNIKAWLDTNKTWHGPVAKKDCIACHQSHAGDHFRLVKEDYPQAFYAPYSADAYALCFSCHREPGFSTAQTTTLTRFRDGSKNLHFVHLQQVGRGRTCRACHEVHASNQDFQLREGVPYGSSGWTLKLNYKKTPTGGSCEKTCHQEKSYTNASAR